MYNKILLLFCSSLILKQASLQNNKLKSFCNTFRGCQHESLICYQYRCECAPGFEPKVFHNSTICKQIFQDKCQNEQCSSHLDPFRICGKSGKCDECSNGTHYDKIRQRCVSMLGQSCIHFNEITDRGINKSMICRNGVYVCRPNYYPDDQWTHCKTEPEPCKDDKQCQMFSDYYRICRQSRQTENKNKKYCFCDRQTRENKQTLQCVFIGSMMSSFVMMPFFLLPMCLMIAIVAYVGHRLFSSSQNHQSYNQHRHHHGSSSASTSNGSRSRTQRQCSQPDLNKSPSAFNELHLNDSPPSYDLVLREQQRIQEELQEQPQQQSANSSPSQSQQQSKNVKLI